MINFSDCLRDSRREQATPATIFYLPQTQIEQIKALRQTIVAGFFSRREIERAAGKIYHSRKSLQEA